MTVRAFVGEFNIMQTNKVTKEVYINSTKNQDVLLYIVKDSVIILCALYEISLCVKKPNTAFLISLYYFE